MKELALRTKHFLIQKLEHGKPVNHPVYVQKTIWQQIVEIWIKPTFFLLIGLLLGWLLL